MVWRRNAVHSDLQVTARMALRYEYKHNSVNLKKLLGKQRLLHAQVKLSSEYSCEEPSFFSHY